MMWKALSVVTNNESPIVVVLSESMSPAFERGDILYLTMHSDPLKVGDICVFNIKGRDIPIVHRIHKVHEVSPSGAYKILTKGDNNEVHDRGLYNRGQKWLENGDIVGRVKGNTPYLGLITIIMNDFPQATMQALAIFMTLCSTEHTFLPMESGLNEYKSRKVDWNAYEENKLISNEMKNVLHDLELSPSSMSKEDYQFFELLKSIKDFVARIRILVFSEFYFKNELFLSFWLSSGRPYLDLLLTDSAVFDLEAYQKCKVLLILSNAGVNEASESLLSFLKHCSISENKEQISFGSLWLQFFLERPLNRAQFANNRDDFIKIIVQQLHSVKVNQIQYQFLFCIWLLTFESANCRVLLHVPGLIPRLLEVAKASVKEKIIRLVVSCFINFLKLSRQLAVPLFVGSKVVPFVESLASRKIADEELMADVHLLNEDLSRVIQKLSTFDEYSSEIKSGQLEWSPPHKAELFWKDNSSRLEENDLEILKLLAQILSESQDAEKLAIACSDIGFYVECHPSGKKFIERLGIKQNMMRLISHHDPEVRYYALNSVQKYLSNLWSTV